jgi:hypothetical protein
MKISDILEKYECSAKLGIIDLGWENGWNTNTINLDKELRQFWVKGTYRRKGFASSQKMSVDLKNGDEEYQLQWQLDSGD